MRGKTSKSDMGYKEYPLNFLYIIFCDVLGYIGASFNIGVTENGADKEANYDNE